MLQPLPDHAAAPQKGTEEMARATPAVSYQGKSSFNQPKARPGRTEPTQEGCRQTGRFLARALTNHDFLVHYLSSLTKLTMPTHTAQQDKDYTQQNQLHVGYVYLFFYYTFNTENTAI